MNVKTLKMSFWTIALSVLFLSPAFAVIVKSLALEELISKSDSIFIAHVEEVSKVKLDDDGLAYQSIQLKVKSDYKNVTRGAQINFKQVCQQQVKKWKHLEMLPIPKYKKGQTLLFFMSGKSSKGYQMPIGFEQGQIAVKIDKQSGEAVLLLKSDHKNIFKASAVKAYSAYEKKHQAKSSVFTVSDFERLLKEVK